MKREKPTKNRQQKVESFVPMSGGKRDPRDTTGGFGSVVKFQPLEGKKSTGGFGGRRRK